MEELLKELCTLTNSELMYLLITTNDAVLTFQGD